MKLNVIDWVAIALLIVGGLNWGLVGVFDFNLVGTLFGDMSALSRIIYSLVGLAALYMLFTVSKLAGVTQRASDPRA